MKPVKALKSIITDHSKAVLLLLMIYVISIVFAMLSCVSVYLYLVVICWKGLGS